MEQWLKLKIGDDLFIAKFEEKSAENLENSFTFWLSDFKTLWNEYAINKDNLLQRLAEENPSLEINDEIPKQLMGAVGSLETANAHIKPDDDEIKLQVKLLLDGKVSIDFYWLLKRCEPQLFFEIITKPLLHQVGELQFNKMQLIGIIKKKDAEINQYKLDGALPLTRTGFITEPFVEEKLVTSPAMFNCAIDDFQNMIGPIFKHEYQVASTSSKKQTIPRGKRHRVQPVYQEFVKPGRVTYESDDDEEQPNETAIETCIETATETFTEPTRSSPPKRIRRTFKL